MSVNRFIKDSMYLGTDYHIDLSEEVNGIEQRFRDVDGNALATFSGGIRDGDAQFQVDFTFTLLDDFTVRCSFDSTDTINTFVESGKEYDFGVRVNYSGDHEGGNDFLLFQGKLEIKTTLF